MDTYGIHYAYLLNVQATLIAGVGDQYRNSVQVNKMGQVRPPS
jgi:hypothetical protein